VVKVIWQKGRIAAAHGRFDGIRQVAPVCTPPNTCFLGPPESTTQMAPFSRICSAYYCDRPTDRQTDRPRYSVCNNRPHLHT